MSASITVAVIDDQEIVLAGVVAIISNQPDLHVVGTASDLAAAAEVIRRTNPDVVVSDIQLGDESGLDLLDHFPDARPPIVFLSAFNHPTYYQVALDKGAAGYVLKAGSIEKLIDAIRTVATGGLAFSGHAQRTRLAAIKSPSQRELEVVQLVAEGASNDEIAGLLSISARTVDSHLRVLFDRYLAASRTELAMLAISQGWLRTVAADRADGPPQSRNWLIDKGIVRTR